MQVHAELLRVLHVERMFGVDEGAGAAELLHLGHHLQGEGGLARGFRTVDFNDAAARKTAHAQGDVEPQGAGGHHLDVFNDFAFAQAHDGALAELLLDLGQCGGQGFGLLGVQGFDGCVHENLRFD